MADRDSRLVWGHVNINVSDLDRSIAFYEKLGFETFLPAIPYLALTAEGSPTTFCEQAALALGLPPGTRGRACIMQLDSGFPKIDLIELDADAQTPPPTNLDLGVVRLCLASRDLAREHARLVEAGVSFLSEPRRARDGMADIATCVDPDGTLIELLQIHLERWPHPPSDA